MPPDCVIPGRPSYALVTARPSRDPTPPLPTAQPTPASTPADSLSQEGTNYFNQAVPAGSSITVPIDFEGSSYGAFAGYADGSGLVVTFGGKGLKVESSNALGKTVWAFSCADNNPADGDLVIKNPTKSAVTVGGYSLVMTRRHLTLDLSTNFPRKGQPFTLNLNLTEAADADDVAVSISDPAGKTSSVDVTKTGTGRWTGTATAASTGEYQIRASTTGSRMRGVMASLIASAGDVSVSPTFKVREEDPNTDGLIDQLILTPTVTVADAGEYTVRGTLYDQAGVAVGHSSGDEQALTPGAQAVDITFDGNYIYKSGRWGPYTLHVTVMHEAAGTTTIELDDAVLGQTAAYDYLQFEHMRITIDDTSIKAVAVDTNGDGYFEEVRLTGSISVETADTYTITADLLVNDPWDDVARQVVEVKLPAGSSTFTVVFDGSDIAKSGRDGPYEVSPVSVDLNGSPLHNSYTAWPASRTPSYKASQFR
jgi:hypothetical protein